MFNKLFFVILFVPAGLAGDGLISSLVDQLGVESEQAELGTGAIFNYVKSQVSEDDFSQYAGAIPGLGDYMKKAKIDDDLLGSASSLVGGGDLGALASLAGSFDKLNLDSGLVQQFLPVIMKWFKEKGTEAGYKLLEKTLA